MSQDSGSRGGAFQPALTPPIDPTGVPGMDVLLGGGLSRGAAVLVVGAPGSGKTTIAGQMAFAAARAGRRVLILTALSEPSTKLLAHLRTFTFFDDELIGDSLRVLSLEQFLPQGLGVTADELRDLARRAGASLVVLDGFRGLGGTALDPGEARHFLYRLGTALAFQGATTLITSEAEPRDAALFPEATTADVLIGIHYGLLGMRHRRLIEAVKVRGGAPLPGLHALALGRTGAIVHPRLETRLAGPVAPPGATQRAATGLVELDGLLGGGLPGRTTTLLLGSPGTGKTLVGLHFALAGVEAGEPVLYLSFRETAEDLRRAMAAFTLGPRLTEALASGESLTFLRSAPVELDPDAEADRLIRALEETGARRLVIDSISELEEAVADGGDARRLRNYLTALNEVLRTRGVTALILREASRLISSQLEATVDGLAMLSDNVLLLQQLTTVGTLRRVLSILKMRFSAHDVQMREFEIAPPGGIRLLTPPQSGDSVLDDVARQQERETRPGRDPGAARGGDA
jgi:circadian clock protein KaiC